MVIYAIFCVLNMSFKVRKVPFFVNAERAKHTSLAYCVGFAVCYDYFLLYIR